MKKAILVILIMLAFTSIVQAEEKWEQVPGIERMQEIDINSIKAFSEKDGDYIRGTYRIETNGGYQVNTYLINKDRYIYKTLAMKIYDKQWNLNKTYTFNDWYSIDSSSTVERLTIKRMIELGEKK